MLSTGARFGISSLLKSAVCSLLVFLISASSALSTDIQPAESTPRILDFDGKVDTLYKNRINFVTFEFKYTDGNGDVDGGTLTISYTDNKGKQNCFFFRLNDRKLRKKRVFRVWF